MLLTRDEVTDGHTFAVAPWGCTIPMVHIGSCGHHVALAEQLLGFPFFLIVGFAIEHHQHLSGFGMIVPRIVTTAFEKEVGSHLMLTTAQYRDMYLTCVILSRSRKLRWKYRFLCYCRDGKHKGKQHYNSSFIHLSFIIMIYSNMRFSPLMI